jgi:hypothetical protein
MCKFTVLRMSAFLPKVLLLHTTWLEDQSRGFKHAAGDSASINAAGLDNVRSEDHMQFDKHLHVARKLVYKKDKPNSNIVTDGDLIVSNVTSDPKKLLFE